MKMTLEQIRNKLFLRQSCFHSWSKKDKGIPHDPFLSEIFNFLSKYPETQSDYNLIIDTGTSHSDFCKGRLRSDGYYPLRNINEKLYSIFCDSMTGNPDDASVIQDIAYGYSHLKDDFATELQATSPVFELICLETCYESPSILEHLRELLKADQLFIALAWMTIIAIFPIPKSTSSKKPNYTELLIKNIFSYDLSTNRQTINISLHESVEQFIKEKLKSTDELEEVRLGFNHGMRWLINDERNQLLCQMIERTKQVKILITEYQVAENFTEHLRKPNSCYVSSYVPPQKMWDDFCKIHSEKITMRVSPIPLLRQYMEFQFKNAESSSLYVGFYTYGGIPFDQSHFLILSYGTPYYRLYQNEFEYLWKLSTSISEHK